LAAIPLDGIQFCKSLLQNLTRFGRNGLAQNRSHSASVLQQGFSPSPDFSHTTAMG
jgi:hypothetical protein